MSRSKNYWLYLLFFLSGFPALIYQSVWQRALFSIYGTNIQSITMIVAIFLFGLGLGALCGGGLSKIKAKNLLRYFAILELSIGVLGFFSLQTLSWVGTHTLSLPLSLVSIVVFCLLLLPTIMMGASLPILVAYLTKRLLNVGESVGSLYAANTFGAAFACFSVAFFLMHYFGQTKTVNIAAGMNCIVGLTALALAFFSHFTNTEHYALKSLPRLNLKTTSLSKKSFLLVLLLSALTGYIALSYEILWVHVYSFVSGGRGPSFALFLGYFLAGIAFGSYLCAKYFAQSKIKKIKLNYQLLSIVLLISAITSYLVIPISTMVVQHSNNISAILLIVTLAAMLFGIIFPLLSNYFIPLNNDAGAMMGFFYFANIIGSTISVLLTGFVLMNFFSLRALAQYLFVVALLTSLLPLLLCKTNKSTMLKLGSLFLSITIIILLSSALFFHHAYEKLLFKTNYKCATTFKYLVENNAGIIAVTQEKAVFGGGVYDGFFNLDPIHNVNDIWRAYAIPLFAPHPHDVLMIGLSSGSWAQVLANNPEVKNLTIIEINPGYLALIVKDPENAGLLNNPKVHIIIDDGRRWLTRNKKNKYDLIVINASFYWRTYATFLLSENFFHLIQEHLTPSGIFYFNTTNSWDVVKTALNVFPQVYSLHNFILASNTGINLDRQNLKQALVAYMINQQKVFNLENQKDQATLSEILSLPEKGMNDRKALEEKVLKAKAQVITDDNMLTEWK